MKGRRQLAIANRDLQTKLDECQAILAAAVIQYGHNGLLTIRGEHIAEVGKDADRCTLALRLLTNGDLRVDFTEPELEITAIEEATCSST